MRGHPNPFPAARGEGSLAGRSTPIWWRARPADVVQPTEIFRSVNVDLLLVWGGGNFAPSFVLLTYHLEE